MFYWYNAYHKIRLEVVTFPWVMSFSVCSIVNLRESAHYSIEHIHNELRGAITLSFE